MYSIGQISQFFRNWKGRVVFSLGIGLLQATITYAQTDSVKWALTSDTNAVAIGNVSGYAEAFSNLIVRNYNGGICQKSAPTVAGDWVAEAAQNIARYVQFAASPLSGYNFTVTTISFTIGWAGTSHIFCNVYYSTDSTFATKTQLGTTITVPNPGPTTIGSNSLNIFVNSGQTLYVRFYPWADLAGTTKSLGLAGMVIGGASVIVGSPAITLSPSLISFGTIKANATKDTYFTLSGSNLNPASDSIRITAPTGFQVSTTLGKNYSSYFALPYSGSTLNLDTIYVRFVPSVIQVYSDNIKISGGGITPQTVSVSGTAVDPNTILGIFVSTSGSDADSGTYNHPYLTIQKAVSMAKAGDTIFVRAGSYANSTMINLSASGTDNTNRRYLFAYGSERPILDFSSMVFNSSNRGINLSGSYWYIKGFSIYRAGDNGMNITGSNNIIEFCSFYENQDSGLQLSGTASNNRIRNCDSYFNYDAPNSGGNADGFSPKQLTGVNNYFYGCRSWQNSDDGWDCYGATASVIIDNCWTWSNGYIKDGSDPGGNGNGFKVGGNSTENDATLKHCLSFGNKSKGFDQNHNKGSMTFFNCTGYNNVGNNYSISEILNTGKTLTITNCIELGNKIVIGNFAVQTTNSWLNPFKGANPADFISLDTAGVRGPRKADGSLPDLTFLHLVSTSQFVDAGTDVGLPFLGRAPDLGCFESSFITSVKDQNDASIPNVFTLYQNYPNPFNPSTTITYQIPYAGTQNFVSLQVYDILGRNVATLVNEVKPAGTYMAMWNASGMSSGMYFIRLSAQTGTGQLFLQTGKMLLTK